MNKVYIKYLRTRINPLSRSFHKPKMIHCQSSSYRTMILLTISLFDRKMITLSFFSLLVGFEFKCFYFVFFVNDISRHFHCCPLLDLARNNGNCYTAKIQLIIKECSLLQCYIYKRNFLVVLYSMLCICLAPSSVFSSCSPSKIH